MPTGYKPGAADCSRLAPSCDGFLPVLNPVVIPGLCAGTCCVVLRVSLLTVSTVSYTHLTLPTNREV